MRAKAAEALGIQAPSFDLRQDAVMRGANGRCRTPRNSRLSPFFLRKQPKVQSLKAPCTEYLGPNYMPTC